MTIFCIGSSVYWTVDDINFRAVTICISGAIIAHIASLINVGIRLYYVLTKKQLAHSQTDKETPDVYMVEIYQQLINRMHMITHSPSPSNYPSARNSNHTVIVNDDVNNSSNMNNRKKMHDNDNNNDNNNVQDNSISTNNDSNQNDEHADMSDEDSHSNNKEVGVHIVTQLQLHDTVSSYQVTATKEHSAWNKQRTYLISNCLIAVLGIGKYQGMNDLIGVSTDYKNLFYTFYQQMKYSIVYMDNENIFQYKSRNRSKSIKSAKSKRVEKDTFKLEWDEDEIYHFIDNVKKTVVENKHDSLMLFISSHGDSDGVILDSSCEEISLTSIFAQFFGNKCLYLLDKPKLFVVDSCRGSMRSKIRLRAKSSHGNDKKGSSQPTRGLFTVPEMPELDNSKKHKQNSTDNGKEDKEDKEEKNNKKLSDINEEQTEKNPSVCALTYKGDSADVSVTSTMKKQYDHNRIHSDLYHRFDDLYHNEANTRFLFANPDGYAAVDGGIKGGYLIQATKHVFCKRDQIYQENLDNIVNQIRLQTRKLVGAGTMQNVEDVNRINFNVLFQKGIRK